MTDLTFVMINSGNQILLSDATLWRTATDHAVTVRSWKTGDPVEISAQNQDSIWCKIVTNLKNGSTASVLPSKRMSDPFSTR